MLSLAFQEPLLEIPKQIKQRLPVSQKSKYEDMLWDFSEEITRTNVGYSKKCIRWNFELDNGKKFSEYADLMESAKDFIYSLKSDPIGGRSSNAYGSFVDNFKYLRHLLKWMIDNNYGQFSELNKGAIEQYEIYLKNREARTGGDEEGRLKPGSLVHFFGIVRDIYLQRGKIADAIMVEPFDGESAWELAGITIAELEKNKTKRIPDEVAVDLLGKAFNYVEVKSGAILQAMDAIDKLKNEHPGKSQYYYYDKSKPILNGFGFDSKNKLSTEKILLRTACYIIIAYFSGVRVSEGVSIKKGCIEKKKHSDGTDYYMLHSTLYKTVQRPKGDAWLVPEAVVTAVGVLERLSEPLRVEFGHDYLFVGNPRGNNSLGAVTDMNRHLKDFVEKTKVVFHNGKQWNLTTHQFRKSFAYYMARENKCNLKFLQQQFKHVSMDMTLWYVITEDEDLELLNEVDGSAEDVSLELLHDIMTPGKNLGGAGGVSLAEHRDKVFAGMAGEEIHEKLKEDGLSDMYVRNTIFGLCVFNEAHADCNAGFDCLCNPNKCKNAVVTDEYKEHWVDLLKRNKELLSSNLSPLQRSYTQKQLDDFILPIFKQMKWKLEELVCKEVL